MSSEISPYSIGYALSGRSKCMSCKEFIGDVGAGSDGCARRPLPPRLLLVSPSSPPPSLLPILFNQQGELRQGVDVEMGGGDAIWTKWRHM